MDGRPRMWRSYGIGIGVYHMKLLLRDHEFSLLTQSVHQLRSGCRCSRTMVFWEPVGAVKYARLWLIQILRQWFGMANRNGRAFPQCRHTRRFRSRQYLNIPLAR